MTKKNKQNLITRSPVVVVLGHIDHGKTSILDFIRKAKVVEKESGGITQHIGAYQVCERGEAERSVEDETKSLRPEEKGRKITFIDTPGHEAFSAMRSRGAKVADIAILVIDACEGVKDQTKEAILAVNEAKIPMIVAINKIDKPEADSEKIKRELSQSNVLVESTGGKIPSVEISAVTGKGVPELLELILLVAEMENLKSDISKLAEGVIVEARLDSLRGPTAVLILNKGILKTGDIVGTFSTFGKIKSLEDFKGLVIQTAEPSVPIKVIGFEDVPKVGDSFKVFPDIETAKNCLNFSERKIVVASEVSTESQKVLNLILKTDCLGSSEAVEEILKNLPQEKIILKVLKSENGEVNESDVKLAKAANAQILAFRVKISPIAKNLVEREKVRIIQFQVIYELVEKVRNFMEKKLEPETIRIDLGKVKALVIFLDEKKRQIVGGKVINGEIRKGVLIEVLRNEELVGKGKIINLQRDKKNIEKITKGEECGMLYEGSVKIEEGDILTAYIEEKRKSEL